MAEWEHDIDEAKDYYKVLGVSPSVSNEELKAAYVQLALIHHPDTAAPDASNKNLGSEFVKISEAWSILSRPEVRSRYDSIRGRYLGLGSNFGSIGNDTGTVHSSIPVGFHTQKATYGRVQHHAGSTMEDTQMKLRIERWHNMPLSEKKAYRTKPISSLSGTMLTVAVPVVIVGGLLLWSLSSSSNSSSSKRK